MKAFLLSLGLLVSVGCRMPGIDRHEYSSAPPLPPVPKAVAASPKIKSAIQPRVVPGMTAVVSWEYASAQITPDMTFGLFLSHDLQNWQRIKNYPASVRSTTVGLSEEFVFFVVTASNQFGEIRP